MIDTHLLNLKRPRRGFRSTKTTKNVANAIWNSAKTYESLMLFQLLRIKMTLQVFTIVQILPLIYATIYNNRNNSN
ncbi:hypothetical protein THERMOS_287 [Bathymodiolus thermophilus thioautotrophic gill symbiont]|uniref:Uncharacterized protein n=1 Tax=Bathymodiolus thermophilus thioautotrophic gill symbiont TaxID=2360 RepID=A0A1J5UAM7_9GAMM|nr:hypothetical protein BGC33_06500 [Bathymodiolus thermophilus thioautotrophic gill symbiont]CAB5495419.1 hypothetical protein THERMOS_287 [Bathymodiolus thermophilus thioautotrophic gill symbiont]